MRDKTDSSGLPPSARIAAVTPYALAIAAVLLAWQIVIQPFMLRAPVEAAIRLAPGSPGVLRRAAEAELMAGRSSNAAALARDALVRSPFDVRALRIVGLTEARAGRVDRADELLTLAGNWSLRDDPAHAWLVEYRLRRGDYASAFAHADTLVRRREDIHPQVFRLFTTAAAQDPQRALPVVSGLLAARPPWRTAYLTSLYASNDGLQVAASLAVLLQSSQAPLTTSELQEFYAQSLEKGQIEFIKAVRARLNRPRTDVAVTNGSFDVPDAPEPFQWSLVQKAGAAAEIRADDLDQTDPALRVEYDGYSAANMARQRTFLAKGRYRFRAESRTEAGEPAERIAWTLTCAPDGETLATVFAIPGRSAPDGEWATSTTDFSVPDSCPSQWLELRGLPLDRRTPMVVWFDQIAISPLNPTQD